MLVGAPPPSGVVRGRSRVCSVVAREQARVPNGPLAEPLAIVDAGVLCPLGLDVVQAAASVRAQIHRKVESGWLDLKNQRVVLGSVPDELLPPLPPALARARPAIDPLRARLLQLAVPALQEVLGALGERGAVRPPLLLVGPHVDPPRPPLVDEAFLAQLEALAAVKLERSASTTSTGRAGLFAALGTAARLVAGGRPFVVVGGIDSHADEVRLGQLERQGRLQTTGPQDAFTPGEGAAFLLVTTRALARDAGMRPLALVSALAVGHEVGHVHSSETHLGDGLSGTLTHLLAGAGQRIAHVVAGLNGERIFAREWGVAMVRNREAFAEPLLLEHPAEFTGDLGAALAPFMVAVTALHMAEGRTPGPTLVWAASDHAERGALLLHAAR
jgi:3-oxoacyl-[acyl-carrier-protein] synthase-1